MNKNRRSLEFVVYIVILLMGVICILISRQFDESMKNILISIGTSIIAASIIYFLLHTFVGDPLKPVVNKLEKVDLSLRESINLLEQASKTGMVNIWSKRAMLDSNEWIKKMKNSTECIDILGYAIAFLPEHPDFKKIVIEKQGKDCKIRILLGNPKGTFIKARDDEELNEGSIASRIDTSLIRIDPLIKSGYLEVRLHDTPLYCSIYRFDSEVLVTPQLYGTAGSGAPLLAFKKVDDGIFDSYTNHFNNIWDAAEEYKGL